MRRFWPPAQLAVRFYPPVPANDVLPADPESIDFKAE